MKKYYLLFYYCIRNVITNDKFDLKSANTSDEARLDIKAKGFWRKGETAFFRCWNPPKNLDTPNQFRRHEDAKKREYLERVLQVEHASFTPLVFGQMVLEKNVDNS